MQISRERTKVGIVGAGVAGLTLALFLRRSGVDCVIFERRDRAGLEQRQRAGVVEARAARMFERWGVADKLLMGPVAQTIDYRLDGSSRIFEIPEAEGSPGRFCTQQILVLNLLRELVDAMGGDVRFEALDVAVSGVDGPHPVVSYSDASGRHEIECDFVAGCDADRGVSRTAIPEAALSTWTHEFGYAWLAVLAEAPLAGHPIMAVSRHGCAAQLPRGPQRSRFYLQCRLEDGPEDWSDERIWEQIRLRLGEPGMASAPILDKFFVPLRSVVHSPMRHGRLFLAGDAAHLVPPTSAKGMNLALYDVDVLASALVRATRGDESELDAYSDTCLRRVWRYQDFAIWMTDMMHDGGDPNLHGEFRREVARARLDSLFENPDAAKLHADYQQGLA
ncbi:4-hydroxybenzoate 3-monooxygenase [Pseudomonas syringae]|uniref:4-hydroxybenzoate 3-monooxygenase n=1 Tax=Pseudomonas syringae TaxID=317 RepID=UPI00028E6A81|nr:4-hydroxybenzoate 3-monooxygenase [Pseudomonas syringae]EKG35768.1 P-hydroxybenzoate hydroxylase [Pseudomonas syringae pv. avellanae str. ISPaVe037]